MFGPKLGDAPLGTPWDTADWDADPGWDFTSAAGDTPTGAGSACAGWAAT